MACGDKWADGDARLQAVADPLGGHGLGEPTRELVVDAALDEKVVRGIAGLSHVPHLCDDGGLDGGIEVRVVEDDEGGVPAELHRGA